MRVALDGRGLGGYSATRGIGTYLRGVLSGLTGFADLEVTALVTEDAAVPAGVARRRMSRRAPGRYADLEHDLRLPVDIWRAHSDVFWSPATDPPRVCRAPWVQTLHDVIPLQLEGFPEERERWLRYRPRFAGAARVIAPSQYSADAGAEHLGIDPERIVVAPHGVDPAFSAGDARDVAAPYLLYVGEFGKHKGYAEVFEVIHAVAAAGLPHRLKLVGRMAPWVRPQVEAVLRAAASPERVDLLGYVEDLPGLYRGADVMCVTSRFEGFGLPAAEAMASGTPVVSFANSALTEVVAGGGILIEDGDTAAFSEAVIGLLRDESLRSEWSAKALRRATSFDWTASAAIHRDAFLAAARA